MRPPGISGVKAWDKYKKQVGANATDDYIKHQTDSGRGGSLVPKGHRTERVPSYLKPSYDSREDIISIMTSGKPTNNPNGGSDSRGAGSRGGQNKSDGAGTDKYLTKEDFAKFQKALTVQRRGKPKRDYGGRTRKHGKREPVNWHEESDESTESDSDEERSGGETESEEEDPRGGGFEMPKKGKHKKKD